MEQLTNEEIKIRHRKFQEVVEPVMKYLAENYNPHTKIIIESNKAEMVMGKMAHVTDKFIPD